MTISETGVTNGAVIAAEIQEFVHQLSKELASDERDVQRDARAAELAEGLEAAQDLHDKASATRKGAYISGSFTIMSGGFEVCAATQIEKSTPTTDLFMKCAGTAEELGRHLDQLFTAAGTDAEARSTAAQAVSRAHGHQADEAGDNLRNIEKVDDSAKELLKEITDHEHAAMMAILARQ